jgi:hypothetical protein
VLSATTQQAGEAFTILETAPVDSKFRGVSFAPSAVIGSVPEPTTYASMIIGFGLMGGAIRRRQRAQGQTQPQG